ncbi:2Fe-2S iron-sulfur cluster-binding protein [Sphingobium sp. BYY-5]|uniref:2Fe-2S iron-sulfur cluster-binding protein n=1 Tax=Sphingobium sp. BYY-5 TaxID=2926400 RepID=UPI001FA75C95|nr:2Fe-2S iron-sulfur cluster-binding protein [Sphingobium sp. BYY-5]MCI4591822.1 2Fe-2S iron-sulfur cluster-binding protein [Sphingobium sp. BYY-5]
MTSVTVIEASGTEHVIDVPVGETVMRAALNAGIDGIVGECGGGLACATCHCYVDEDWADRLEEAEPAEREMLECTASELRPTSRLSCQIIVDDGLDGLIVHLPETQY